MARVYQLPIGLLNRGGRSDRDRIPRCVFAGLGNVLSKQDRCCPGVEHSVVGNHALHRSKHPFRRHVVRNVVWNNDAHDRHDGRNELLSIRHGARNVHYARLNRRNV